MKKSLTIFASILISAFLFIAPNVIAQADDTVQPADVAVTSIERYSNSANIYFSSVECSGYEIEYSLFADFSGSTIVYCPTGSTSITINGLTPVTQYFVRVRAYNSSADTVIYGNYSAASSFVTPLEKMTVSKTSSPSLTSIKISFNSVTADKYELQISENKSFSSKKKYYIEAGKTSYTVKKLKNGKTYYARIRAVMNSGDTGEWSSTAKQKTYKEKKVVTSSILLKGKAWSSKTLATVKKGKKVRYISKSGRWYKVIYNGKTGYMYNLSFKKKGSTNISRSKVTSSNYKTYLDDILFKTGKNDKAIYNYVKNNMSYSYSKISSKQRKANINSLSDIYKNEDELVAVAIRRKGGICYNYAALAKALYDRRGGHDIYFVYGSGKYGVHCWIADKTKKGIRYTDVKRKAYFYTASQMKSRSNTSDLRWTFSTERPY